MLTYEERSIDLAVASSIAVLVCASEDFSDIEMLPIKPAGLADGEKEYMRKVWPGRGLRTIGVMGLVGASPRLTLREPIDTDCITALSNAFLEHVHATLCDGLSREFRFAPEA
jgi:hypothetical protein